MLRSATVDGPGGHRGRARGGRGNRSGSRRDGRGVAFNAAARRGEDPEFGRGQSPRDRHLGDPAVTPNPCLAPVETAPFFAVPVHAGVLGTAGGLATDGNGQVVDHDGAPLPGLYAVGNCAATLFHDAYPGGGATLGSAVVRAYRVGQHLGSLARSAEREVASAG
ncbi:FAD-binding protein [Amycolatopsis methanolica]|uniref:FAD-binding protein n=1 Tax=Amycolatopsis methanolica TaxID=1814 RepID=UPI0039778C1F